MITQSLETPFEMADVLAQFPLCYFSKDETDKRVFTDGKDAVFVELVAGMKVAGFTYEVETPLSAALAEAFA